MKIWILEAEEFKIIFKQCHIESILHCDALRRAHYNALYLNLQRIDHPIFYLDTLVQTYRERIETVLRQERRLLFPMFMAHMEKMRLTKRLIFGEVVGSALFAVSRKKRRWVVFPMTSALWVWREYSVDDRCSRCG